MGQNHAPSAFIEKMFLAWFPSSPWLKSKIRETDFLTL